MRFGIVAIAAVAASLALGSAQSASQPASQPAASQAVLEQQLAEMLSDAELVGSFRMTSDLAKKAPLGEPIAERYRIVSAVIDEGDWWIITARIQYMQADVTVPLRMQVRWSADTPMIVVDELMVPGIGKYSARVMLYRGYYSGTWFGENYGGVMGGEIRKAPKEG